MKAILVKYLAPTDTKGVRLKASAEGVKSITRDRSYDVDSRDCALLVAQELADKYGWGKVKGFGMLPNGDYAATLGGV